MTTRDDILTALLAADPGAALRAFDITELNAKLSRAQAKMRNLAKDTTVKIATKGGGSFAYSFAPLEDYLDMARAAYASESLTFTQHVDGAPQGREQTITLTTAISFGTAQVTSSMSCVVGGSLQDYGSAITYLRRYTLQALTATCGTAEDEDVAPVKTGPRVESEKPAERERAAEIRSAAKTKAEAVREEPQQQPRPWPALHFREEDPPAVADARYVGAAVMELLGADFFGNPPRGEGLYQTAHDVGEAMLSKAPVRPQGPAQITEYCAKMRASVAANPKRLDEIKARIADAVPF